MRRLAAVLAASLAPAAPCALADELGGGVHYSTGDYGLSSDTEITSLVFTAERETGDWRMKLTVPYLEVTGPATVIPGIGNVGRAATARTTSAGLGDIVGAATYALYFGGRTAIDLTGRVKLPTADADEGLGTGETDFGFQVDAYQAMGRVTPFAGVGYTVFGDPAFTDLKDVWNYSIGATVRVDERDSAGLSLDGRQQVSASSGKMREIVAYWMRRFEGPWRAQFYFLKGFADGSPDFGLGATALYAF
jgi:hypothetical protein